MDKATQYLLIKEANLNNLFNSMKLIIPSIESALLRGNAKKMKMIAKKLPKRDLRFIEGDAIRQIPGFKKAYSEAQRKVSRYKVFNNYTSRAASVATAIVSASTKTSVDEVFTKGVGRLKKINLHVLPSYMGLIKLGLFALFIASIFITQGAVIIPTLQVILRGLGLIFSMIGGVLTNTSNGLIGHNVTNTSLGDYVKGSLKGNINPLDPTTYGNHSLSAPSAAPSVAPAASGSSFFDFLGNAIKGDFDLPQ